ncbi:MAG: hypothetical protein HY840_09960 [Bacteroidetes bacterium]|nr:hypothetical protein [Bacteroidota bacterium]
MWRIDRRGFGYNRVAGRKAEHYTLRSTGNILLAHEVQLRAYGGLWVTFCRFAVGWEIGRSPVDRDDCRNKSTNLSTDDETQLRQSGC